MKKLQFTENELHTLMWQKPNFAQIELTRNCNQSCLFCFANCDAHHTFANRTAKEWKEVIDRLERLGVGTLHFTGGECLLYPEIKEIVKYAKEKGMYIQVNTNGTLPIQDILPFVDAFVFSVHGIGEQHNQIVHKKDSFEKIEENIQLADTMQKYIQINTVLIKRNFKDFINIYTYFKEKYTIAAFSPTFAAISNNGTCFEKERIEINEKTLHYYFQELEKIPPEKLAMKHGLRAVYKYKEDEKKYPVKLPVCAAGKDKLIIKYNGNVYPCNFFENEAYYCGNVFEEDLQSIWQYGKGFVKFRNVVLEKKLPEKCMKCQNKICYSGCRVWTQSYREGRDKIENERDIRCEFTHAFIGDGDYEQVQPQLQALL